MTRLNRPTMKTTTILVKRLLKLQKWKWHLKQRM